MPFVVRPKAILGTPKQIALDLSWKLRYYPHPRRPDRRFVYSRDFLMFPVKPVHVLGATEDYLNTVNFAGLHKFGQRKVLENAEIPCPKAATDLNSAEQLTGDTFVVRPYRHSGGSGYRVTSDRLQFTPGEEYISELFPKRREYRVIFLFGKPLVWLRKKPHDGATEADPWGAANSSFQTINDILSCRLAATDCISRLAATSIVRGAHICAADILYNSKSNPQYSVLELNFCPGVDIDVNRAKIVEGIRNRG